MRCRGPGGRARPSDEDFPGFWPAILSNIAKKMYFFRARHLVLIYTPKEAHSRIFVTGASIATNAGQKKLLFWGRQLVGPWPRDKNARGKESPQTKDWAKSKPRLTCQMSGGGRTYFGNLEPGVTKEELEDACCKYGKVADVWVARNPPGFAFVVRLRTCVRGCRHVPHA